MRIVPFEAQYLPDFISLNEAWMNELFGEVEETDKKAFEDAERIEESSWSVTEKLVAAFDEDAEETVESEDMEAGEE